MRDVTRDDVIVEPDRRRTPEPRNYRRYVSPVFRETLAEAQQVESGPVIVTGERAPELTGVERHVAAGWRISRRTRAATVMRRGRVHIIFGESWWRDSVGCHDAAAAWRWLEVMCQQSRVKPHLSSAYTGTLLWEASLGEQTYPVLPANLQDWVRAVSPQGRIVTVAEDTPVTEATMVRVYDMHHAYMAVLDNLPDGAPSSVPPEAWDKWRYWPGWWPMRWNAPTGWDTVGLLPCRGRWPLAGEGIVSAVEADLALRYGWDVTPVGPGLAWDYMRSPYREWLRRLHVAQVGAPALADRMVHAMIVGTLGATHRSTATSTHYGSVRDPAVPRAASLVAPGVMRWQTTRPRRAHPEWTGTIWARTRVRLMSYQGCGALHVPVDKLVALATDAIYTTATMPAVRYPGVGQYRLIRRYQVKPPASVRSVVR